MGGVKEIGDQIIHSVKAYVAGAHADLSKRMDGIDARLSAIPAGPPGERGEPGAPGCDGIDAGADTAADMAEAFCAGLRDPVDG